MKSIQRILCFSALAFVFSLPALSAGKAVPAKKRAPVALEASPPAPVESRPGDAPFADQLGLDVYQVLLAEIALQRGDLGLATKAYSDLALRTREPKVLERTIEVAGFARRYDLAFETARLWLDIEPGSTRAQQLMTSVMVLANRLDDLAPHLVRMIEADQASVGNSLLGLNRMFARNPDRQAVFGLIDKVCRPFFGVPEAYYAVAMAASSASVFERALAEVGRALELRADWEMAALLKAQLLSRASPSEAVNFLQGFVERNPKARDAQLNLARGLVGEKRYGEAKHHFEQLLQTFPDNPDVVYPAAILALQQNERALAEAHFKHLVGLNMPDKSTPYFYLGQIAEDGKRIDEALAYYAQVGPGERYIPAQMRSAHLLQGQGKLDAARRQLSTATAATPEDKVQLVIAEAGLLREAKQPEAAFELMEKALAGQPDDPDFLYETALFAERLGRMDVLETNLRKLIVLRPDNAQAYNALGYSYADRNIHLTEARELIEKALKLTPDDAFILDSLGWVQYRQGDLAGALVSLQSAYAKRDDPEVAAHLAEVLWALGRTQDARRTLREALEKYPANELLADAVKKFAP